MDQVIEIVCHVLNISEHDLIYSRKLHLERTLLCCELNESGFTQREIANKLEQSVPSVHYQIEKAEKIQDDIFTDKRKEITKLHTEYLNQVQEARKTILKQILK